MTPDILLGSIILILFLIAAGVMFTRKMPALLVLPIMAVAIALAAMIITRDITFTKDILGGVISSGSLRLHEAIIVAFFGGMLSFMMQKTGVAEHMIKQAAELIGDNPIGVALFSMTLISLLFTSIGGLGAIIMVSMVFLPMMATVGITPLVAGGIMLIGISLGGLMNAGNWILFKQSMGVEVDQVKGIALLTSGMVYLMGAVFVCVELYRAGSVRSLKTISGVLGGILLVVVIFGYGMSQSGIGNREVATPWSPYNQDFGQFVEIGEDDRVIEAENRGDSAVFSIDGTATGAVTLMDIRHREGTSLDSYKEFFSPDFEMTETVDLSVKSTRPMDLQFAFLTDKGEVIGEADHRGRIPGIRSVGAFSTTQTSFEPRDYNGLSMNSISGMRVSAVFQDDATTSTVPSLITLGTPIIIPKEDVPLWKTVLQVTVAIFFAVLLLIIFLDLRKKVRRWRQQVVEIKWYAYLIPIIPLVLILVYDVNILASFLIGFLYAILVTLRPGSMSLSIQSMIQGASAVMPAALLMIGIGILLNAVLGPRGWSAANQGMEWPVSTALKPLLEYVVPTTSIAFVLLFGILAPLALYRGPFNLWGLGFGVAGLLLSAGLPGEAVLAMMLIVGQIQGICDPTNTHNVWLANELRVDVQALMWRTLPYVWVMVFIGLAVSVTFLGVMGK